MPDRLRKMLEQSQEPGINGWIGAAVGTFAAWGVAVRHLWRNRSVIVRVENSLGEIRNSIANIASVAADTNERVAKLEGRFAERDHAGVYIGPERRRRGR